MLVVALTAVALATAALSGMTGLGGGTVLIAALYALGFVPTVAVPLHAGVQLVSNGTRTLAYLPHVDWRRIGLFLLGALPTPFLMAPLVARADPDLVRLVMAAFIGIALWPAWLRRAGLGGGAGLLVAGVLAGGAGMVVGATGLLIAPFFLRHGWSKETVIATMAVCQTALHLTKIAAFSAYGFGLVEHWRLLLPMALAVIAGTLLGRRMVGWFDERRFRQVFRAILMLLALRLGYDGATGLLSGTGDEMDRTNPAEVTAAIRGNAGVSADFDFQVVALPEDGAEIRLPVADRMLRLGGTISGPTLMTLVDAAMYAALIAHVAGGEYGVTSHLSIEFLRRPPPETLYARAAILRAGRRQVACTVVIESERERRLVVHATGAYALFNG